uniref:Uncharacterized protein n=1 Tax=Meloidogyne javanica TaxID=6303 RepID=A0A915MAA2_MELJA
MNEFEWNKLYWRITHLLISEKMNDICDKLIHLSDKREDSKLVEESNFYYRIYSYGVENEEYTVNKLLYYNLDNFDEMSEADQAKKHLHNFNISEEDNRRIAELHLTAIMQLIYFCEIDLTATQVQGCSSNVSTIIPTKSQLTISLENMTDKDLIGLTKLRMRKVLGDLMLEELEMDQPVLFKIGKFMRF